MIQTLDKNNDNYLDNDILDKDLFGNLLTQPTAIKSRLQLYLDALKEFGSKHPTSIIVTLVQFYLLVIMVMLHSNIDLIIYTLIMMTGYIMGSVAVIIDNTTYKMMHK